MLGKNSVAVLGIGNLLCKDDGIGVRVIQRMLDSGKYAYVDLIDGGTSPDLLCLLDDSINRLIIVDALKGGGQPGDVYRLDIGDENIADESPASLHGLGVLDSLKMMRSLGMQPPAVTIIGVEPADTSPGLGLSAGIEALIPSIIDAIDKEIRSSY